MFHIQISQVYTPGIFQVTFDCPKIEVNGHSEENGIEFISAFVKSFWLIHRSFKVSFEGDIPLCIYNIYNIYNIYI